MAAEQAEERTLFAGNLDRKVNDSILYELFLQAGPIEKISLETAADTSTIGVIVFKFQPSVPYAVDIFRGTQLYDKELMITSDDLLDQARNEVLNARNRALQHGLGVEREPWREQHGPPSRRHNNRREFDRERESRHPYHRPDDRRHYGGERSHYSTNERSRDRRYDSHRRRY